MSELTLREIILEIIFVLVKPAVPENIGAAARAIKTMGFGRLRIVGSDQHRAKPASILAHGAREILEQAESFESLPQALEDIDLSVGTSAKSRLGRRYSYSANELSAQLEEKQQHVQRVAIVFGCEESGLSNEELDCCDMLSYVPIANSYPSLNLGQAVMIYAYSLTALTEPVKMDDTPVEQWSNLKHRSEDLLQRLAFTRDSKLYRWAMERLAVADSSDIKFLHLLLNRLTDRRSDKP